jgi:hypothetical protein
LLAKAKREQSGCEKAVSVISGTAFLCDNPFAY